MPLWYFMLRASSYAKGLNLGPARFSGCYGSQSTYAGESRLDAGSPKASHATHRNLVGLCVYSLQRAHIARRWCLTQKFSCLPAARQSAFQKVFASPSSRSQACWICSVVSACLMPLRLQKQPETNVALYLTSGLKSPATESSSTMKCPLALRKQPGPSGLQIHQAEEHLQQQENSY